MQAEHSGWEKELEARLGAGPLPPAEAVHLMVQALAALEALPATADDLYKAGGLLYRLITGRQPDQPLTPPADIVPAVPPALNEIMLVALAPDPAARFQSARAFRNALASVALPPPVPVPAARRSRRGLWIAAGAAAALLVVVAAVRFAPSRGTGAAPESAPPAATTLPPAGAPPVSVPPVSAPPVDVPPPGAPPVPRNVPAAPAAPAAPAVMPPPAAASPPAAPPPPTTSPDAEAKAARAAAAAAAAQARIQRVREDLARLGVRASTVSAALERLQEQQARSGLNLRADIQESSGLMSAFLDGAGNSLNAGDLAAAGDYKDKAERQIEKLEKFLGR
jgi:serine/threonine-protein kinase